MSSNWPRVEKGSFSSKFNGLLEVSDILWVIFELSIMGDSS